MADTSFTAQVTTILAAWLNAINNFVYRGLNPVYATTTGTADAQVLTITGANSAFTSLSGGESFTFKAGAALTNTGAMTLQIVAGASIAAKSVKTPSGGDPGAGAVTAGGIYTVVYEASADVLVLLGGDNPPIALPVPVASGGTGSTTAAAARSALSAQVNTLPTRQVFLSGTAATYTTPAGVRQLRVRMKGGGAGGNGSGDTGPAGGSGGTTIFNSINANGGSPGTTSGYGTGGSGGTGGTGTASLRLPGAPGGSAGVESMNATNAMSCGGMGGGQGGGVGGQRGDTAAGAGVANSGGGGGGGGLASVAYATFAGQVHSGGGGEGEYVELVIDTPAATYTYTVGAGGAAGTAGANGFAGAAGGSGYIVVDEYY